MAALMLSTRVTAQIIWAVHDGERLESEDLNNPNKNSNSVWDGTTIRIFGARNEVIAFQVIFEAGDAGIQSLSAGLSRLQLRGGAAAIDYNPSGGDPTDYRDRPIQIFCVNYMEVTQSTRAGWIYRNTEEAAPEDPLGWKPVQLVPENATAGRGGFPLQVAANRNQAIWIDVYTDRQLPAGTYDGIVTINIDGTEHSIPVELELFDFTLPDSNSMNAMVYFEAGQLNNYHGSNLTGEYHRFAHRQRIELVHRYSISSLESAMGRFDGSDFTQAQGYAGPGEGTGNRIAPRSFYGPGGGWDDRSTAWQQSDEWMTYLNQNLPGVITFLYMVDEPGPSQYPGIRAIADNVHSNPGPGSALPIFVTNGYDEGLAGAIDIWCSVPSQYDIAIAVQERAEGRDYWWYNGGRPSAGAFVYDAPATDARMAAWASFKHGVTTHFYWHGNHWRHNSQMQVGERNQNIWQNPITFDNRDADGNGSFANGDGVLMYPGEEVLHPEEDRGISGPVSSVRLANLRRGLQDHLYLTMAAANGAQTLVDQMMQLIVPKVFSDADGTIGFSEDGNEYETARYQLAQAISNRVSVNPKEVRKTGFTLRKTSDGNLQVHVPFLRQYRLVLSNVRGEIAGARQGPSTLPHVFPASSLAPGLYVMELRMGGKSAIQKMLFIP
jgi:hypothetical protein